MIQENICEFQTYLPLNMTNCDLNVVCVDRQMGEWWHCDLVVIILTVPPPNSILFIKMMVLKVQIN
jgi:hypothetical protein